MNHPKLALLLALIASPTSLLAKDDDDTLRLEPKSEWQLRAFDDKCRISRTFGSGDNETTLWIDKGGPGPAVNVTLIGEPLRNPFGPVIEAGFTPGSTSERNYIVSKSSKGRPVIALFGVQPIAKLDEQHAQPSSSQDSGEETVDLSDAIAASGEQPATRNVALNEMSGLTLDRALKDPIHLKLEGFSGAADQLLECTEALTNRLIDNARLSNGVSENVAPTGQAEWARKIQMNYPYHLLREGQQGWVGVRLTVNGKGRATFCEVIEYGGPASFNDTACLQLLRHSRFTPARDAEGNPVAAFFQTRVVYRLR